MQFKALAILSFLAITGAAQKCEKGNNHNQGGNCNHATGNLACSHNLKHVVSTLTTFYDNRTTSAVMVALTLMNCLLISCLCYSSNAIRTVYGRGPTTVS
jgi:hypothetical protein